MTNAIYVVEKFGSDWYVTLYVGGIKVNTPYNYGKEEGEAISKASYLNSVVLHQDAG